MYCLICDKDLFIILANSLYRDHKQKNIQQESSMHLPLHPFSHSLPLYLTDRQFFIPLSRFTITRNGERDILLLHARVRCAGHSALRWFFCSLFLYSLTSIEYDAQDTCLYAGSFVHYSFIV